MKRISQCPLDALAWVRFVLNPNAPMPQISDWQAVYDFATRQAILGICDPTRYDVRMPQDLLFAWIGDLQTIRTQNQLLNKRAAEVYSSLSEVGFRCCILKGQGNALMYPEPGLRCPGDVDVWVDKDEETLYEFIRERFPDAKECVKHIKFPIFTDVDVDVHHTPLRLFHPNHRRAFQQWLTNQKEEQFSHFVRLPETKSDIAVPTAKFNAVYQLGHMMIHLFDAGVGFRQLIDYYYVLKEVCSFSSEEHKEIVDAWKSMGMLRLASAVMWIESEILGLPERYLLIAPDQRLGEIILADVLEGGNFGHYSERQAYRYSGKRFARRFSSFMRLIRLSPCFPGEVPFQIMRRCAVVVKADIKKVFQ